MRMLKIAPRQRKPQCGANDARVGDDNMLPRAHALQRGPDTRADIVETFPIWGGKLGKAGAAQGAKIGQIGKGHTLPCAKVLLPQAGIVGRRRFPQQGGCGLHAAPRGAGTQRIIAADGAKARAQGGKTRYIAAIGINIAPPRHSPAVNAARVADKPDIADAAAVGSFWGGVGGGAHFGAFHMVNYPCI